MQLILIRIIIIILSIILLICLSCRSSCGDNDLGNNFSLLDGDKREDRLIVYCSGRSYGACYAGTPVVPTYNGQHSTSSRNFEYVETAKANGEFIIAQTIQPKDKRTNYWIVNKNFRIDNCDSINCDSIIQSKVVGPMNKIEFDKKTVELDINLQFD